MKKPRKVVKKRAASGSESRPKAPRVRKTITGKKFPQNREFATPAKPPKKPARRAVKKPAARPRNKSAAGYRQPPAEYQFQPGRSGNPGGRPQAKTHIWSYLTAVLAMTAAELARHARKTNLCLAERIAIRIARQVHEQAGEIPAARITEVIAEWIDRDEGRATERIRYEHDEGLSVEECEEIRQSLAQNLDESEPPGPGR